MKNKLTPFIVVGAIVVVVVFLFWAGQQSSNPPSVGDDQTANISGLIGDDYFNFGEISMANGKVKNTFKGVNATSDKLTIDSAYTSCMCTQMTIRRGGQSYGPFGMPGHGGFMPKINMVLEPGEEFEAEVVFDP